MTGTTAILYNRRGEPWYSGVCRRPMYHPAPPKTYLQILMYQTFTSKASLFSAAKKIMAWYILCIFFRQEPSTCARWAAQRHAAGRISSFAKWLAGSLLLAELSSFANYHIISVCAKPAARRALLFHKLPRNILQYPPNLCARKACCSQSSPLSASYTNHTFFRRLSFGNPLWQNPKVDRSVGRSVGR
jgi:hypothetical protein